MIVGFLIAIIGAALCIGGGYLLGTRHEGVRARRTYDLLLTEHRRCSSEYAVFRRQTFALLGSPKPSDPGPGELWLIRGGRSS